MNSAIIVQHTNMDQSHVDMLLQLSPEEIFTHADYIAMLESLDLALLEQTLDDVKTLYDERLPAFKQEIQQRGYNVNTDPMSAYTLGTWLVGVVRYPESASQIMKMHERVPGQVVADNLPALLEMIDTLPSPARETWKAAICTVCLPMFRM